MRNILFAILILTVSLGCQNKDVTLDKIINSEEYITYIEAKSSKHSATSGKYGEIYISDLNGNAIQLTDDEFYDCRVKIFPNKHKLIFMSNRNEDGNDPRILGIGGQLNVFLMDLETKGIENITEKIYGNTKGIIRNFEFDSKGGFVMFQLNNNEIYQYSFEEEKLEHIITIEEARRIKNFILLPGLKQVILDYKPSDNINSVLCLYDLEKKEQMDLIKEGIINLFSARNSEIIYSLGNKIYIHDLINKNSSFLFDIELEGQIFIEQCFSLSGDKYLIRGTFSNNYCEIFKYDRNNKTLNYITNNKKDKTDLDIKY